VYVFIFWMENDLSDHKFKIGQSVLYSSGICGRGAAGGVYKVKQLLPSEGDDCQYRIKSSDAPHERVVKVKRTQPRFVTARGRAWLSCEGG